ncbi:MAG: preprotein translocase subunit SecY [Clostridia bacterium]|nr:preprotein translocase subunit SecY [Clostridia bacterium]
MFQTLVNAFKNKEVRNKILITLALLFVYRLGCWLPVPGISATVSNSVGSSDTLLTLLSSITGGALANGAWLAIGISPYINASIIIQLLTIAFPALERLSKQGAEGRKKLNKITRFVTLGLAIAQAVAITVSWGRDGGLETGIFTGLLSETWMVGIFVAVMLISGSMFTLWVGERITENGIGNGISLLIFVGILSSAGLAIIAVFTEMFNGNETAIWELLGFLLMVVLVFGLIVFVDLAERKIPVQYAKQIKGRKQFGGQSTFIPLKVNASGVLPIIFATSIITFPQVICQTFFPTSEFYMWYVEWLGSGTWLYSLLSGLLILFFCYFYAQVQFNPEEVARNIQQYGGFIPGIRPGKPTYEYLVRISKRITLFGAIYLAFIAIVPSIVFALVIPNASLVNSLSATGMLIVVSVALEFDKQLESQLMMKHYKGFLK